MFLSSAQTRALSQVVRLTAEATDADLLREQLAVPMLGLLNADTYVSMAWNSQTQRFERAKALNMSLEHLRSWDEYYRFIDPLTRPMMQRRRPTVATQVMPQAELSRTEFFNDFLQRDRMHWGVNVYFCAGDDCVGDFRIWRHRERGNFTGHEIEALRLVEPAVTAALARTRGPLGAAVPAPVGDQVERLMQKHALLSRREAEVAWLVSSGCPDKEIARQLKLQFPTVRYHLGNAFRKMQAENRTGLANRVRLMLDGESAELMARPVPH
jgi:DNA-binding CsgD family transcriptional regulator